VQSSSDSGASFNLVYSVTNAGNPALAVASDGTVGMLYLLSTNDVWGTRTFVRFSKAVGGNFGTINDRVLAAFPDGSVQYNPTLGDFFTLKAVGSSFFGAFCAWNDPQPANFPSGVFFQRYFRIGGVVFTNSWLTAPATLVCPTNGGIAPIDSVSVDPFFFYDIPSVNLPILIKIPFFYDPVDPLSGVTHMLWSELGPDQPQFQLFTTAALGAGRWVPAANTPIISANGQFEAPLSGTGPSGAQPQAFFRLQQDVGGAPFQVFAAVGNHGTLDPKGFFPVPGMGEAIFTATPDPGYAVSTWYLDGTAVQSGGSTLMLSNVISEHTLVASFVASNDLAVGLRDLTVIPGPTVVGGTNDYKIAIVNDGLNMLTGVVMTNPLPATVAFVSASSSQGSVMNNAAGVVSAEIGSLGPGASALVNIRFIPLVAGSITDIVNVACSQVELDPANNVASNVTAVIDAVTIANQPVPQSVPRGGTAVFSVGVSGTPPFFYQWFYNGTNAIADGTSSTLTLTNVTGTQAGLYSVVVFQTPGGPEDVLEVESDAVSLTVGGGPAQAVIAARKGRRIW
jgi:uncharacterized repeat protein (TIGR01451 family)